MSGRTHQGLEDPTLSGIPAAAACPGACAEQPHHFAGATDGEQLPGLLVEFLTRWSSRW